MIDYHFEGSLRVCFVHQNYAIGIIQSFVYQSSLTKFIISNGVPELYFDYRHINENSRRITRMTFHIFVSTKEIVLSDTYSNRWFV